MVIKNKCLNYILSISLLSLSLNAQAVKYHNINPVGNINSVLPMEKIPVVITTQINNMATQYITNKEYKIVSDKTEKILPTTEKLCDEDGCTSNEVQKTSNFEIGSMEKGFFAMAKSDGIDENQSRDKLFKLLEKINNADDSVDNNEYLILLNTISGQDRDSNELFISLAYDCKNNGNNAEKIISCMFEKAPSYKNIFLNLKLKCYGYVQDKNYTSEEDLSNSFDSCLAEEMESDYVKEWLGYQFFALGSLLYYLQKT